jgi:tetratricopeptide (TPR) repeat protein
MRSLFFIAWLASSCATARLYGDRQWVSLRSEHFDVLTDGSEENARFALRELETIRAAELRLFFRGREAVRDRTLLVLFNDETEVRYFTGSIADGFTSRTMFGEPLIVAGMFGGGRRVLAHEMAHRLTSGFLLRQPRWLSEGIATYLETVRVDSGGTARLGRAPFQVLDVLLRGNLALHYGELFKRADFRGLTMDELKFFYAASWALVHWLADEHEEVFADLLRRLAAAEDPVLALSKAFPGVSAADLDREVHAWLGRGEVSVRSVKIESWKGEIETQQVKPAESHAMRAELFLLWAAQVGGRAGLARARDEAREALEHDPGQPVAALVQMNASSMKPPERLDLARRAVASHGDDARAFRLLASALRAMRAHNSEVQSALEEAARLTPDNPFLLNDLAWNYATHGRAADAVGLARKAVAILPGESILLDTLAVALAGAGQCEQAVSVQRRALEMLSEAAPSKMAEKLRARFEGMEAGCKVPVETYGDSRDEDDPTSAHADR